MTDIKNKIASGALRPGDPLISEKDCCKRYGISLVSVRRALHQLEAEGLIEKKWGKGNFVSAASAAAPFVGVIVPNVSNPMFSEYVDEISRRLAERNCHVVLGNAENIASREEQIIEQFAASRIMKVLLFPNVLSAEKVLREKMAALGIGFVTINDFWTDLPGCHVRVDEAAGVRAVMEHLFKLGHKRVAFLDYSAELRETAYRTYSRAMEEAGAFDKKLVCLSPNGMMSTGLDFLLKARGDATACFVPYDVFAVHYIETLKGRHGYRIPEDLAIAGFDDIPDASKPSISLTTVRQPKEDVVRIAVELLLDQPARGAASTLMQVQPSLMVRRSTAGDNAPALGGPDRMPERMESLLTRRNER